MSVLSPKVVCSVCNGEAGLTRKRIANKNWVCASCYKKSNLKMSDFTQKSIRKWTTDDFKEAIEASDLNNEELTLFKPTKKIGSVIEFDDNQKKWLILSSILGRRNQSTVYNYSDIVEFELLEDGESLAQGGLGRALVGGALFGGAGSIVGGITGKRKHKGICTNLQIKVTINDMNTPAVYIPFITTKTKKSGFVYKEMFDQVQECMSTLQLICDQNKEAAASSNHENSITDEIKKYKELLDIGAITEDEYNTKKVELLNT